jgi:uncharacterized membrane protein YphA (DoxX/SURF4 family)
MLTVMALVVLRLNIGWHFFREGVNHYTDPSWTSEATLRSATGPLASWYQAYLPDVHGFRDLLHREAIDPSVKETGEQLSQAWVNGVGNDWDRDMRQFVEHYGLDKNQQQRARDVLAKYQQQLRGWAGSHKEALVAHVHEWRRNAATVERPSASDVPFERDRTTQKERALLAEASGFMAEVEEMEHAYRGALESLLNDEQRGQPPLARPRQSIDLVDGVMTYLILAVGVLLLVGLFTRAACVAGAIFLFSVVMMQPFWVSDALPTYNQFVEMFALVALATTHVGRWAGLDYFVHRLLAGPNRQTKGRTDVLES